MPEARKVVIASACRTPIGVFQGGLSALSAPQLGGIVIREALQRAGVSGKDVSEVIMGEVLAAGVGQAPGRRNGALAAVSLEPAACRHAQPSACTRPSCATRSDREDDSTCPLIRHWHGHHHHHGHGHGHAPHHLLHVHAHPGSLEPR